MTVDNEKMNTDKHSNTIERRTVLKLTGTAIVAGLFSKTSGAFAQTSSASAPATTASSSAIIDMPAWELSQQIHGKHVSCVEVMSAYLDHIEKVNPAVNAIVALQDRGGLLKQAKAKDALLAAGKSDGWMHGFPHAVKDLAETKGIRTTMGSPLFKDFVPDYDDPMVADLKTNGAIIIGKTNTPEFGYGSHTYNPVYGVTGNPYDHSKSAGGSSGGAACSLAMRMVPVADGSDFMGSLRNPAGWCNIYGYRPSWGRVAMPGGELFINQFGILGPMGRTVSDVALLLNTQSGYRPEAPGSLAVDPELRSLTVSNIHDKLNVSQKGKKVAWIGNWDGYLPMEKGVLELCEKALKTFPDFGVAVDAIRSPTDPEALWNDVWLPHRHICASTMKKFYDDPEKRKLLKPEAIFEYEGSLKYSGQDIFKASQKRGEWYLTVLKLFDKYDFLAVPTAQIFPFDKTLHWPQEVAGKTMDTYHRWMEVVTPWTLCGCPIVAIPAGFNENGVPMGIQVIGRPRGDFELLQFAYAYEKSKDWFNIKKPAELMAG